MPQVQKSKNNSCMLGSSVEVAIDEIQAMIKQFYSFFFFKFLYGGFMA